LNGLKVRPTPFKNKNKSNEQNWIIEISTL
jgi:hypothetical protein